MNGCSFESGFSAEIMRIKNQDQENKKDNRYLQPEEALFLKMINLHPENTRKLGMS
jgi:hypothetical protein